MVAVLDTVKDTVDSLLSAARELSGTTWLKAGALVVAGMSLGISPAPPFSM